MRDQRFGGAVGQPTAGEVRIVQCQSQARHGSHQAQRFLRLGHDGADVGFNAENKAVFSGLIDAPSQLCATAIPRCGGLFIVEINAGQGGDVLGFGGGGVVERLRNQSRALRRGRLRMIGSVAKQKLGSVWRKTSRNAGCSQPAWRQRRARFGGGLKNLRRVKMGSPSNRPMSTPSNSSMAIKSARDRRQQGKGKVGAGEFQLHRFFLLEFVLTAKAVGPLVFPFGGGELASVDNECGAGDAIRIITTEEQDGSCGVVRRQRDAHGHAPQPRVESGVGIGLGVQVFTQHRRVGYAGANAVATNAVGGVIQRDGFVNPTTACLVVV